MKVAVIGGGFAGLAAAVALQEARHEVTLVERRGVLGGRATSMRDAVMGEDVDNGTHLMIGAYTETLDLVRRAGAGDLLLVQDRLEIDYRDDQGWSSLRCPDLPAPLHLLFGLLSLRVPWRTRWDAVRLGWAARAGREPAGLTLAEWFAHTGQSEVSRRLLWDPLATAILNETPERASATVFRRVFREAFLERASASSLVFLRAGYGRLHDRLGAYLLARGGRILRGTRAEALVVSNGRAAGVRCAQRPKERHDIARGVAASPLEISADAVVVAVPWSAVPALVPEEWRSRGPFAALADWPGSPIVSVELWLDRVVVDRVMVGLRDSEVEWVFDKGRLFGRDGAPQHLAFIVSAAHRSLSRTSADMAALAEAALRRYFPAMSEASVVRSLVLREPSATFAGGPDQEGRRPGAVSPIPGLFLAGDWTDTGLPATIEGAVRSGRAAARALDGAAASPAELPV